MIHRDRTGRLLLEPVSTRGASNGSAGVSRTARRRIRGGIARHVLAMLLLVGLGVSAAFTLAVNTNSIDALLKRADEVRSADPQAFRRLLAQIEQQAGQATAVQVEQLRYLQIYRMSLDGQFQQAIAALRELASSATDLPTRFRATAFLANNYAHTRDFAAGLDAMNQALALLPEIGDTDIRHQGLLSAAILYNQAGQYDLALRYAQTTLDESASGRSRCIAGIMRLEALFALDRLPTDDQVFNDEIAGCEQHGEHLLAEFARGYLARARSDAGNHVGAIGLLEQRIEAIEASAYPRLIAEVMALLASDHFALGHLDPARRYADRVIVASDGVEFSLPLVTAYRVLSHVAEQRGDLASALAYQRRLAEVDKAYLDDIKARELAFQFAQHDSLQKTQTIERLNHRNEMLRLESEVDKQSAAYNRLALALLVILLASIALWAYLTKREQLRFRRLAQTDALTGISNRLHFSGEAPRLLADCARRGVPAALVMFDLDAFKAINDRHGHASGDWVLVEVARVCRARCQEDGLFARLGGEEFAILCPGAKADSGVDLAHRCRNAIAAIDTSQTGTRFPVSASFGVAVAGADGRADLDTLLIQADIALYCAKSAGRNRVSVYGSAEASDMPQRGAEIGSPSARA